MFNEMMPMSQGGGGYNKVFFDADSTYTSGGGGNVTKDTDYFYLSASNKGTKAMICFDREISENDVIFFKYKLGNNGQSIHAELYAYFSDTYDTTVPDLSNCILMMDYNGTLSGSPIFKTSVTPYLDPNYVEGQGKKYLKIVLNHAGSYNSYTAQSYLYYNFQ